MWQGKGKRRGEKQGIATIIVVFHLPFQRFVRHFHVNGYEDRVMLLREHDKTRSPMWQFVFLKIPNRLFGRRIIRTGLLYG